MSILISKFILLSSRVAEHKFVPYTCASVSILWAHLYLFFFFKIPHANDITWLLSFFVSLSMTSMSLQMSLFHSVYCMYVSHWAYLVVQLVKNPLAEQETPVCFPGVGSSPGEGIGHPLQYSWVSLVAQSVKNLPAVRETWVRSLVWRGHGNPLQYSRLENSHGQSSLVGYSPRGCKESARLRD